MQSFIKNIFEARPFFYAVGKFKVKQVKTFIFASNEKRQLLRKLLQSLLTRVSKDHGLPDSSGKRNAV